MERAVQYVVPSTRLVLVTSGAPARDDLMAVRPGGGEDGPVRATAGKTCSCGHERVAHEHYRRGTDCALCGCARYRRPFLTRLLGR